MPKVADPSALGLGSGPRAAPAPSANSNVPSNFEIERQWGSGAKMLPDGSIVRDGPRGGRTVLRQSPDNLDLTEDQGKAQTYARLMAAAEGPYQQAISEGYDPNNFRVIAARTAESIKGPVGSMIGSAFRNDLQDRAQQAELLYQDPVLKSMTGAAQGVLEERTYPLMFTVQPGQKMSVMGPQTRLAREAAYKAALVRSGPAKVTLPETLPSGKPASASKPSEQSAGFAAHTAAVKQGRIDKSKPFGSRANPYVARSDEIANRLPRGSYVYLPNGSLGVVE